MKSRNTTEGFAIRTLKNLKYVKRAWEKDRVSGLHVVAQLGNSLLGLVVMPREDKNEENLNSAMKQEKLEDLESKSWPKWHIIKDTYTVKSETLFDLLTHLRNAVAHRRIRFSCDSRELSEVTFVFEDQHQDKMMRWQAEIGGLELYRFCCKFADYIQRSV